jgi:myo-inositol 2-dehydrogenase/D-chiro-inositol 1-dehydrogenase
MSSTPDVTPLRVGIIGGGWIARVHVPAIDAAPELELVAACDTALERAEAIAKPRGGRAYARWQDMLEHEQLDALWVCTPPLLHRAPVEAALAGGTHVYLEKPIARALADADAIVAAAGTSTAICAVGYQYHASELLDDALALLEHQQVGLLISRNLGPVAGRPWFMDRAQGGGQILERASHHIDLQQALAGRVASVQASAGSVDLSRSDAPSGIDDAVSLTLHFEDGALGSVHTAWTRPGQPELYALDIVASDATLALQLGPQAFRLTGRANGEEVALTRGEPMDRSIARFVEAVRRRDRSLVACSPAQARDTLAVALACERALESGTRAAVER